MKQYVVYSIIFHAVLIALAIFLIQEQKVKERTPFLAQIVTPEELERTGRPPQLAPKGGPPSQPRRAVRPRAATPKVPPQKGLSPVTPSRGGLQSIERQSVRPADQTPVRPSTPRQAPSETQRPGVAEPPLEGGIAPSKSPVSPRDKLFDRDVLAKLSLQDAEQKKPDKGITFETKDYKYYGYMRKLKEKIESIWHYPSEAAQRGIYGDLYIQFTITKNGRISTVELVRTSGYKLLDDAAIRALRDGDPYWPIPDEWGMEGITITGHFVYTLHGTYLR